MKEIGKWTALATIVWGGMGICWTIGFLSGMGIGWEETPLNAADLTIGWRSRDATGVLASIGGVVVGFLVGTSNWFTQRLLGVEFDSLSEADKTKVRETFKKENRMIGISILVVGAGAWGGGFATPYEGGVEAGGVILAVSGLVYLHGRLRQEVKIGGMIIGVILGLSTIQGGVEGYNAKTEEGRPTLVVRGESEVLGYIHRFGDWVLAHREESAVWMPVSEIETIRN